MQRLCVCDGDNEFKSEYTTDEEVYLTDKYAIIMLIYSISKDCRTDSNHVNPATLQADHRSVDDEEVLYLLAIIIL